MKKQEGPKPGRNIDFTKLPDQVRKPGWEIARQSGRHTILS